MLGQLIKSRFSELAKRFKPPESWFSEPDVFAFAEHAPDEPQRRFKAFDAERATVGYGSLWANGDVAIQWSAGPSTLIAAGGDWERFFVEWAGEY